MSKKSNATGFARGGGGAWAVLELTGTLCLHLQTQNFTIVPKYVENKYKLMKNSKFKMVYRGKSSEVFNEKKL